MGEDYRALYHQVRQIKDLKDLVAGSVSEFGKLPAFLVKDKKGGPYREITYEKFQSDVNALGTKLISLGLKGERVAIIGENCYHWIVAYFAVINGTGVVVPLDKELSKKEIHTLLKASSCKAAFYTGTYEDIFTEYPLEQKYEMSAYMEGGNSGELNSWESLLASGYEMVAKGDRSFIDAEIDEKVMCSMLFTSGTTGVPKAVMLSHENLATNVYNTAKIVKLKPTDRSLSMLPIHHTFESTIGILAFLYRGGSIAFFEGLKYIAQNMKESEATLLISVPLVVESIYDKIWKGAKKKGKDKALKTAIKLNKTLKGVGIDASKKLFASVYENFGGKLRLILCGAASLDPNVARGFEDLGLIVSQGYGLTETAPLVAGLPDFVNRYKKAGSVGPALPEGEMKIVDANTDGIGEIIYRGPNVMLGYYNMPEETAAVIKDGWFYTGDLGFMDENGWLYITGRKRYVIVTKTGKNIYPEELEAHLLKNKYIEECMVYGMDPEDNNDTIVSAQVRPNYEVIYEEYGSAFPDEQVYFLLKRTIADMNVDLPNYKHIRQVVLRKNEFIKTTTKKIKRQDSLDLF